MRPANLLSHAIVLILPLFLLPACERRDAAAPAAGSAPATTTATAPATARAPLRDEGLIAAENRGVGQMGRYEFDAAAQTFYEILERHGNLSEVRVNFAIAVLNRQHEGDNKLAMKLIDEVLAERGEHLRARYVKALLLLNGSQPGEALTHFHFVADADPRDPYAIYYVGQCLAALGRHEEALAAYQRAVALDPALRSAYYGAFQSFQRLKKPAEAKAMLEQFQKLRDHLQARLVEFKYTRMGPKAEAVVTAARDFADPAPLPAGPLFADPAPLPLATSTSFPWEKLTDEASLTAADVDGDGAIDLFIASATDVPNVLLLRQGEQFQIAPDHPLTKVTHVRAALWGDFDNDGLTDVYLCRRGPNQLWRQTERNQWQDVTEPTQTAAGDADTTAGAFFDADHDGDLDLLLTNANGLNELLNNNGDGTFRALGAQTGLAGDGRPSLGLLVHDLDNDGDADVVILNRQPPHEVFLNDRSWQYRRGEGFQELLESPISALVAADVDADGQVELYGQGAHGITRWTRADAGNWDAAPLAVSRRARGTQWLCAADVDGSGAPSLFQSTDTGWSVLSLALEPAPAFDAKTDAPKPLLALLDPARGPSVIALPPGKPPIAWSPGPGRHPFLALSLTGRSSVADQMRSNASGIGVRIAARVSDRWIAADSYSSSFSAGQSLQPIWFGLDGAGAADFVRFHWPDGLQQTELGLAAGQLHRIEETQRQTSSCPVIFAWDGSRYVFVTDCLGVGGIGFAVAPGEYVPPRPWENVLLRPNLLQPRDGRYLIKLGEPMEEACYLDSASLVAYDLPPGWAMTLDERMATGEPKPTGEARFYRRLIVPARATNDRGEDVTATVTSADHVAAPVGEIDRRFIGRLQGEHVLTLHFADALDEAHPGSPMLVIDGWVEYPYAQTMFAAWQARAAYQPPTLEALGADGQWIEVLKEFGYPAGMPRQMSVPIPMERMPPGARSLRLRTTQEIYFDRVAVAWSEPCPSARRTVLPLLASRLDEVGYAARITHPQRRPEYDYDRRAPLWDARHQDGFYTDHGPVDELLADTDDALALFGPGEEIHLEFAAGAGADLPSGWTQRLVLELAGWCKDRDLYTKDGQTLDPLPSRDGTTPEDLRRRDRLHERFNVRYRSGG